MADIKKIVEALKTIKDECYFHTCGTGECEECVDCVLFSNTARVCAVTHLPPDQWEIVNPVVRVLK